MGIDFSDLVDLLAGAALIRTEGGNADHGLLIDLEFGVRYWDLEFGLDPALLPAVRRGDDWVDGFSACG